MRQIFLANEVTLVTQRELEIVKLLSKGMQNKEIADELKISARTIQCNLYNLFKKLGVRNRSQILPVLLKNGLITLEEL